MTRSQRYLLGRAAFIAAYPGIWLALRFSTRARVLIIHNDQMLVVRAWLTSGDWTLPGGGVKKHETTINAAQRELLEEVGITCNVGDLQPLGHFIARSHGFRYNYDLFVLQLTQLPGLKLQANEIQLVDWFSMSTLPRNVDNEVLTAVRAWQQ